MKSALIEHLASVAVVGALFVAAIASLGGTHVPPAPPPSIARYLHLQFIDFSDPESVALFRESLDVFYPDSHARNDSLVNAIEEYRRERFTNPTYKTGGGEQGLSGAMLLRLSGMYVSFALVYVLVLALSYYGARSLALYRFIAMKQRTESFVESFIERLRRLASTGGGRPDYTQIAPALLALLGAVTKGVALLVLFAPAYVIAYSVRTSFETDSIPFMILLGVISNGLLINYANRFYTFLLAESRKGYVETARVKNLRTSFVWHETEGVPYHAVFRPSSLLPTHVLHHIYLNARYQSLPTIKELASFLITGLVIIEMALNIHGHLCYELLQQILYKQYDVALAIILGIFLLVKATELSVDLYCHHEARRYENRA